MAISSEATNALREAMKLLLSGLHTRSDGELTWTNVCREAGVPRSTAARAGELISEWKSAVRERKKGGSCLPGTREGDRLEGAKEQAQSAAQKEKTLRRTIMVMANHIQALTIALERMTRELDQKNATVASLLGRATEKVITFPANSLGSAGGESAV